MGFEAIGFVLERVYDLLRNEASILLTDEKRAIEGLRHELELLDSYLKDMDEIERLATLNHVLKAKVRQLREILAKIEDFLDTITDQRQQPDQPSVFKKLKTAFFGDSNPPLIHKHHLVAEIEGLSESLKETLRSTDGFQPPNNKVTYRMRRQTDPGIIDHEIIIGLEEDVADLVAKFVGTEGKRGTNSVIVGMGGSGKTTLARWFYNHEEINKAFRRRAWVCVSQQWDTNELLLQICAELGVRLSDDERSIPRHKLTEFLRVEGSCLVVLDDVWEREALQDFLPTLLIGNGRVLITTRKQGIIQFPGIDGFHIHSMRRLTAKQSRELFSKIVCSKRIDIVKFKENEGEEEDFAKLGRAMLEKCGGLPIAIVTLAGLLGTKDTVQQWESIKDNVISIIMEDERGFLRCEAVKKVLEFSYFDLPYYLKPCFIYLGTFKEDKEIDVDTLINLWIDEGFIKPDRCPERRRLKEVAQNFLEELVQRCMVQVISRDYAGDIRKVRIHDLMRDLCIDNAKKLGFFRVFSRSTTSSNQIGPCPRIVLHNHHNSRDSSRAVECIVSECNSRMRSLICINANIIGFENLKLLRVLSLEWVDLEHSAEHMGNMVLLRYLRVWKCRMGRLHFLKKLRNLHTFIFQRRDTILLLCDNMFGSMEQLRVLSLVPGVSPVPCETPEIISIGVDKLSNLESLTIQADKWIIKDLPAAICFDLQQLEIEWIKSQSEMDAILCCVNNKTLTRLQTLDLSLKSESLLEFDLAKMNLESNCQLLKALALFGKIKKLRAGSRWPSFPPNLLELKLVWSEVEEEGDMNQLIAQLPRLMILSLQFAYKGANLTMSGLPNLHTLEFYGLDGLKEWRITQGSLPQLQELSIHYCHELEMIPDGITNIKTLQRLQVSGMPRRFCKRLETREEGESRGGEDFHLLQHIPFVDIKRIQD